MKSKLCSVAAAIIVALSVSAATACPKDGSGCGKKKTTAVTAAATADSPCSAKKAVTVAAPVPEDGRSDTTGTAAKTGGCGKDCPCGKSSKTIANQSKIAPCHGQGSKTVADKTSRPPCQGHGARTVADKSSGSPCQGKGAKTVADKTSRPPCQGHGAKTVADKSKDAPCHGQGSKTVADKSGHPPCQGKGTKTVADKSGRSPCQGHGAKTADQKAPCSKGSRATLTSAGNAGSAVDERIAQLVGSMPSMKYRIGEDVTCCSKSAATMAEKSGKPIEFLVGDQVLSDRGEAMAKLTSMLDSEAKSMQAMALVVDGKTFQCPASAKTAAKKADVDLVYRVGGVDFKTKGDAAKAQESIDGAIAEVAIAYKVDGKLYHCDKAAGSKCKESGKKMIYVVGDMETPCHTTAKLKLAETRIHEIVKAAIATSLSL